MPWAKAPASPRADQRDVLRACRDHRLVATRSGHQIGKSISIAGLGLWHPVCHPGTRSILTAPTGRQLKGIVWAELRLLWQRAASRGYRLGPEPALDPATGFKLGDKWGAYGVSTDSPDNLAGFSGRGLRWLVDEASGYPEALYAPMFGSLASGGSIALFGNPTQTSGTFFEAFHEKRDLWYTLHVRSTDTPNFHGGSIDGLANPEFLTLARGKWGEGTPDWAIRVLGDFPENVANAIIGLSLLDKAKLAYGYVDADGPLEFGVDVARYGDDDSVIAARRRYQAFPMVEIHGQDTIQVAGRVIKLARELRTDRAEVVRVKVDTSGLGAGLADHLRATYPEELQIVDVNSSVAAADEEQYVNARSELWFNLAGWLREGGTVPPGNAKLEAELVAPTYDFDGRGRRRVEPKDEIKKRLGRSPDRADAMCLAVYSPRVQTKGRYRGALPPPATNNSPMGHG